MSIQELRADYILNKFFNSKEISGFNTGIPVWFLPTLLVLLITGFILLVARKILSFRKTFTEQSILLELTPPATTEKTAYTTQQLFSVIHNLGNQRSVWDKLIGKNIVFACEIVSTQKQGIRYLIRTSPNQVNNVKRSLLSYLSQVSVKVTNEYLPEKLTSLPNLHTKVIEFDLTKHFAYPLQKQNVLIEHDPVAYITGMMTKLSPQELVSFQIVLSPTQKNVTSFIKYKILHGEDVLGYINQLNSSQIINILKIPITIIKFLLSILGWAIKTVVTDLGDAKMAARQSQYQYMAYYNSQNLQKPARVLTQFEQDAVRAIEEKIDQPLFEAKIRVLIGVKDKHELSERIRGFNSSLGIFTTPSSQSLKKKVSLPFSGFNKFLFLNFKKRLLSFAFNNSSTVLSISEISDLYHFPFTRVTQTENIVKIHSKELPAPLSLKNEQALDITFAKNTYGGSTTMIGLTKEEREKHMYIIGATGAGKSTMILSMADQDIKKGKGVCVIDPHGELAESAIACIPERRTKDFIYFNPDDIKYPIGLNLLELTPGLDEDELLREKELITESVVSLFRKIFSDVWSAHAHRLEYILRNTIQTALCLKDPTIFTVFNLLTDPDFQKQAMAHVEDENLLNFWKNEFGKAGDFQKVKMIGPITSRIGRFLFSPSAKRILEQTKSTINFDQILDEGKILICNLSKGKLGEDTSEVLGIMILAKIQLASLKRVRIPQKDRNPFYLYVDEFQTFATPSFIQMLSESRKYKVFLTMAEQSTSQQKDRNIVNIILANVGTVVSFRSANPDDEKLMLPQFAPYVDQGEITNLPAFHFYMKIAAVKPEEPFSGETMPITINARDGKIDRLIQSSRDNYGRLYVKPLTVKKVLAESSNNTNARKQAKKEQDNALSIGSLS